MSGCGFGAMVAKATTPEAVSVNTSALRRSVALSFGVRLESADKFIVKMF
jgi:hypothetical protein